ncbi:MAG: DUF3450 domain-containing protein [Gammaproteobacteria bacterium]
MDPKSGGRVRLCLLAALLSPPAMAVDAVLQEGEKRVDENAAAQQTVDKLDDARRDVVADFAAAVKVVDGLKVYNALLQKQVDSQAAELQTLAESIEKVSVIERQIVPLMVRMIDGLEAFIALDAPFLVDERTRRIASLREMMERSDVTAAEKFRRVMEAFQIENEYGRTIEAYRGTLELDGAAQQVDFLRFGRVTLVYQTLGGDRAGAWNPRTRTWEALPAAQYKAQITQGLAIARKQAAPDLLMLPVAAPAEVGK